MYILIELEWNENTIGFKNRFIFGQYLFLNLIEIKSILNYCTENGTLSYNLM